MRTQTEQKYINRIKNLESRVAKLEEHIFDERNGVIPYPGAEFMEFPKTKHPEYTSFGIDIIEADKE